MTHKILAITGVCILLICTPVKADINYNLLYNWSYQPPNVQQNLVNQWTSIRVVDKLDWESPDLYDTYAYTHMNVIGNYVVSVDMQIKTGYEETLTHEVGHAISNCNKSVYWWCEQPCYEQIWQLEKYNSVLMAQGWEDKYEYFACAYDAYIRFPRMLKKLCPMTYNYITVVLRYT